MPPVNTPAVTAPVVTKPIIPTPTPESLKVEKPIGEIIDKGDIFLQMQFFRDKHKDINNKFRFYQPQAKTIEGFIRHVEKLAVQKGEKDFNGAEKALELLNSAWAFKLRSFAKAELADENTDEKKLARINKGDTLLVTAEEAENYLPGKREPTSETGIKNKMDEHIELASEAKKEGRLDDFRFHKDLAKKYKEQLDALITQALEDLDNEEEGENK